MGLYSHYSKPELEALRQRLMDSPHARLTIPTSTTSNGTALTPVFMPDAERLQLAFTPSEKVANQASRTVFDAVMAGDDQRKHATRPVQVFSFFSHPMSASSMIQTCPSISNSVSG